MWVVLISYATCSTAETVVWLTDHTGPLPFLASHYLFNILFTIEAVLRVSCYIPAKAAVYDVFVWLDWLTIIPFWVRRLGFSSTLNGNIYLETSQREEALRIFEALCSLRLLKLCRYYEGAALLVRAVNKSLKQLYVPLFMLLLMVFCFACIMFEIEW